MNQIGSIVSHSMQINTKITFCHYCILHFLHPLCQIQKKYATNPIWIFAFKNYTRRWLKFQNTQLVKDDGNCIPNYDKVNLHHYISIVWCPWSKITLPKFLNLKYHVHFHPSTKSLSNSNKKNKNICTSNPLTSIFTITYNNINLH